MFKAFMMVLGILSSSFVAQAGTQRYCGYINCYDQCSGRYMFLQGDTCDQTLDYRRGCYQAIAYCGDDVDSCAGGVRCYDYCSGQMIAFPRGNQCGMQYDSQRRCWQAKPECW